MTEHPFKPFNDAAQDIEPEKSKLKDPLELNPPRDKDNTGHNIKAPSFAPGGASNTAARGALGSKLGLFSKEALKDKQIDITKGDPENDLWIHGKISTMKDYSFSAKVYNEPSKFGIDEGKISKLVIFKDKTPVVNYDRGWDIKPRTARDAEAAKKVQSVFDEKPREFKPIVSKPKDKGHER